jgi:putative glutamine amidotransferase
LKRPLIGITPSSWKGLSLRKEYIEVITAAGGAPVILPVQSNREVISHYLEIIDGLLLSGGVDIDPFLFGEEPLVGSRETDPQRDVFEVNICKEALERKFPVLGICKGCQIMNIAAGGDIFQDLYTQKKGVIEHFQQAPREFPVHSIIIDRDSYLYQITGKEGCRVNSLHHQAIRNIAPSFRVVARARDGVIEAIEKKEGFALGVQWHPESMYKDREEQFQIFQEFISKSIK